MHLMCDMPADALHAQQALATGDGGVRLDEYPTLINKDGGILKFDTNFKVSSALCGIPGVTAELGEEEALEHVDLNHSHSHAGGR
jgi:hypothetical protein